MIPDATFDPVTNGARTLRLRFSLLALFLFVTLVCLLLAWWAQPNRVVATALFRVSSRQATILDDESVNLLDEKEFETVKATQLALIKSYFALNAAVRKPGIASLPILQGHANPTDWIEHHLEVSYPEDAEILEISLRGPEAYASDLVQIVDAVANAYSDEVVYKDRQWHLMKRDVLARSLRELKSNISQKWDEFIDMARDSGQPYAMGGKQQQEADVKLLHIFQTSINRWEDEAIQAKLSGETAKVETLNDRIAQLQKHERELEARIATIDKVPPELSMRKLELEQLQTLASEIARKVQRLEIESQAPQRIELVQPAVASPID
jgi:hypothetical protein